METAQRKHIGARRHQVSTSSAILRQDGTICTQVVQYCDGDCIKCTQAVQYCDEIVLSVHKKCNIATRLYQVYTGSTLLRESLYYLCASSAILQQDGIICAKVVPPYKYRDSFLEENASKLSLHVRSRSLEDMPRWSHVRSRSLKDMPRWSHILSRPLKDMLRRSHVRYGSLKDMPQ